MYRIETIVGAIFLLFSIKVNAQEHLFWDARMDYFFENNEYQDSHFLRPNTTGGIWITGSVGYKWDNRHTLKASVLGLKRQGMPKAINEVEVSAFYQYEVEHFRFRIGALPNRDIMKRYNDFFFTDSLRYHRPLLEGFTLEFYKSNIYDATIWLDWTSMAGKEQRESFQVGATARGQWKSLFADTKLRYFHYAGCNPPKDGVGVLDHGMLQATLGILGGKDSWGGLSYEASTGILLGLEQDRSTNYAKANIGWLTLLDISAFGIGTENTFYIGAPHLGLYPEYENNLYWGNQFLRDGKYAQSKWYLQFVQGRGVDIRLTYTLHYSEGQLFHRQALTASIIIPQGKQDRIKSSSLFPLLQLFQ